MESLGEKLRIAREKKGYTYDQVGRDTNIARRYLEALEAENFSQFPGEPYLLGFLRNYGDYLGLDSQELIALYRSIKIQEQPVPVEQLLKDPRRFPVAPVVGAAVLVAVLVAGAVLFLNRGSPGASSDEAVPRSPVAHVLESGALDKRFYVGDSALVKFGADSFKLELSSLAESAVISAPGGDLVLELGQEVSVDLNGDGSSELSIFVADMFKNNPSKGVALRMELKADAPGSGETAALAELPAAAPSAAISAGPSGAVPNAPVLLSSPNPYPFTLQATFKGFCMFRWESDRKERDERYFHKAEVLNVQAQNGIRLWVSNASAVKLQVIGGGRTVDLEIGGPGEVVVTDLKWVKDDDGRFKLTTVRLD